MLHLPVILFTGEVSASESGGVYLCIWRGDVCLCVLGVSVSGLGVDTQYNPLDTHTLWTHTHPWTHTHTHPWTHTPPGRTHTHTHTHTPWMHTHPWTHTAGRSGHWSGRYASYLNAFLLCLSQEILFNVSQDKQRKLFWMIVDVNHLCCQCK